ncbi:MAG TPA: tetratricopeptide repeat protein, partial [Ktedonobacteraceae bacterium]|nr:tetratricopeptide repeat protein [Ktedonobacteraceae bacterium]
GKQIPGAVHRRNLSKHFGVKVDSSWFRKKHDETTVPVMPWNIPFLPNPYFTADERLLSGIRERLMTVQESIHILCLCGLGGIGKTQIALEYAHAYRATYRAVFWVNAETQAQFVSDLVKIAFLLRVPEAKKQQPNQRYLVNEVKQWLREHSDWLLILDNIESEVKIENVLIAVGQQGHILLTTREQAVADLTSKFLEVDVMAPEMGALFLLRRARLLELTDPLERGSAGDQGYALTLSRLLGGLPLALEQAGAYIHETRCGLAGYIQEYQTSRSELLNWRSEHKNLSLDYGETVATTWLISFKRVEQQSPAASELLQLCAFLYPDAIPEDITLKGGRAAGGELYNLSENALAFNSACEVLLNYSLIRRNVTGNMLAIHRLVQAALQDRLDEDQQRKWAERTVLAIERVLSSAIGDEIEQYLPHARRCANHIKHWDLKGEEVAHLLEQVADAVYARGWYTQATPLYLQTLGALQELLGADHPHVMHSLLNVARVHMDRGLYDFAVLLYHQAHKKYESAFGPDHPVTMRCLSYLAQALLKAGNAQQAVDIGAVILKWHRELQEPESSALALTHQVSAIVSALAGRIDLAEAYYLSAIQIYERVLGLEHPEVVRSLIDLGIFYLLNDYNLPAEEYFQRALEIQQRMSAMDHPETARLLSGLAESAYRQRAYSRAEELGKQALGIRRQKLGFYHPTMVEKLHGIAVTLATQRKDEEAEQTFREAQTIAKDAGGEESPQYLQVLQSYTDFLQSRGRSREAEPYKQQLDKLLKRLERGERLLSFELSDDDEEGPSTRARIWTLSSN